MSRKPISVSQLNNYIGRTLSADSILSNISVTGEISNFKIHGSGHVFFSLKDDFSRINCFLPAGIFAKLGQELKDGEEIVVDGYINVYEKGGSYSLNIRTITLCGQGSLSIDFEKMKQKLAAKGYFDEKFKKTLPYFPQTVAIVTSNTGAAIEDMLKIITTKNSIVDVLVFPSLVQGEGAASMIASQINCINSDYSHVDTIIIGRGGGSAEDLAAFNEEILADAIFESSIPIISAVGHETDFTISDFVADKRAETPTAAANIAVPDTRELHAEVEYLKSMAQNGLARLAKYHEMKLKTCNFEGLAAVFNARLDSQRTKVDNLRRNMQDDLAKRVTKHNSSLNLFHERLLALNPLSVLERGYTIIEDEKGKIVTSSKSLSSDDKVVAVFADGRANLKVVDRDK